jgi:drug/metabolite transporter (DMT)-like permease
MSGFSLIILSALMHSLWNILLKKSKDKYVFNYQMHVMNVLIFSIIYPIFFRKDLYFDAHTILISFMAAAFFSLYHLCLTTAYIHDDVSKLYPITVASPFFILIWAALFLNEKVTLLGILGISMIIFGVTQMNGGVKKINSFNKGVKWAVLSMFFYSIGSIIDKIGVSEVNFTLYVYCLILFMSIFIFLFSLKNKEVNHFEHFKSNYKILILCGFILFLSFFTYRLGLAQFKVTYASALRQVSVLFGVILSGLILKERIKPTIFFSALIIMIGVILIKITI